MFPQEVGQTWDVIEVSHIGVPTPVSPGNGIACLSIAVKAAASNTGVARVSKGGATMVPLAAGEGFVLNISQLADVYAAVGVVGDLLHVIYVVR